MHTMRKGRGRSIKIRISDRTLKKLKRSAAEQHLTPYSLLQQTIRNAIESQSLPKKRWWHRRQSGPFAIISVPEKTYRELRRLAGQLGWDNGTELASRVVSSTF